MVFQLIDRRPNGKYKSAVNRQRFLRRYRQHIKEAVADAVNKRSITDTDRGDNISIPRTDVSEPRFRHGPGGRQWQVLPGNKEFITGDRIARPSGGAGGGPGGGSPSDSGEGLDEFVFQLTQQESLDFMFEDLELPNLVKKQLKEAEAFRFVRGGYPSTGVPARLNVVQSLRGAPARRIALGGAIRRQMKALNEELESPPPQTTAIDRIHEIRAQLERLQRRLTQIPFLDEFDLKYNNFVPQPLPTTSAVMFCLMDVSGSMTQEIKNLAKRFFILLHLFLKRNYQKIDVIFIRHHTSAKEVDEEQFFYSRETGGTVVSSALRLMEQIIQQRYPASDWNIYAAQASDGENWSDDSPECHKLLRERILPRVQHYAYIEINSGADQGLWHAYEEIQEKHPNVFAMKKVTDPADIFPVFHDLFEKKSA